MSPPDFLKLSSDAATSLLWVKQIFKAAKKWFGESFCLFICKNKFKTVFKEKKEAKNVYKNNTILKFDNFDWLVCTGSIRNSI